MTSIPTAATIFRSGRSVLLLDEVDKLRNSDRDTYGEVIAVLNVGFERGAVIERCKRSKGGEFSIETFNAYGPKALAGVEGLADALSDRSFQIQMKRASARLPRLSGKKLDPLAEHIRAGLSAWAVMHTKNIEDAYDQLPDPVPALAGFDDRFKTFRSPWSRSPSLLTPDGQRVRPFSHVSWPDSARPPDGESRLDAKRARGQSCGSPEKTRGGDDVFVSSADMLAAAREQDELGWIESGRGLAGLCKHFDLAPRQKGGGKVRGYFLSREWLAEWASRYPDLSDDGGHNDPVLLYPPAQASQVSHRPVNIGRNPLFTCVTADRPVTHGKTHERPVFIGDGTLVTLKKGGYKHMSEKDLVERALRLLDEYGAGGGKPARRMLSPEEVRAHNEKARRTWTTSSRRPSCLA